MLIRSLLEDTFALGLKKVAKKSFIRPERKRAISTPRESPRCRESESRSQGDFFLFGEVPGFISESQRCERPRNSSSTAGGSPHPRHSPDHSSIAFFCRKNPPGTSSPAHHFDILSG